MVDLSTCTGVGKYWARRLVGLCLWSGLVRRLRIGVRKRCQAWYLGLGIMVGLGINIGLEIKLGLEVKLGFEAKLEIILGLGILLGLVLRPRVVVRIGT